MKKVQNVFLTILVLAVVIITFQSKYAALLNDIEITAKTKQSQINRYIDLSKGYIDLMTVYGKNFFRNGEIPDNELYKYLQYDSETNSYNLDSILGTEYEKISGSLTGSGQIPALGIEKNEINFTLGLDEQFSNIYGKIPEAAWLYYTSSNNFIYMYPWVSAKDFKYDEKLKQEVFYTIAAPENNKLRQSLWTPCYMDQAGKGLMVTLSSPIYRDNDFMGVISIDITNDKLSEMISTEYNAYIIDSTDSVIANSLNYLYYDNVPKFNEILNCSQKQADEIKKTEDNKIVWNGNYYIYSVSFHNAPWKLYYRVSIWDIIGRSMLYTIPIFTICILLLFTFREVDKRRKAEILLKKSLEDLKAYQKLLENAAKYDFLTETVNRRGFMEIFNKNVNVDNEKRVPITLIMGDIDYFKKFNDTYGHAAGDNVLVSIAKIMQISVKTGDVVCRWGGEEFVIMLLGRTYSEGMMIAENIRKEIENLVIYWENSTELKATMTFGVYEYNYSEPFENNISMVDRVLYSGKQRGRNIVVGSLDE